jgi:hypothetical protein
MVGGCYNVDHAESGSWGRTSVPRTDISAYRGNNVILEKTADNVLGVQDKRSNIYTCMRNKKTKNKKMKREKKSYQSEIDALKARPTWPQT